MIFVALSDAADAGELLLVEGGMCRYHLRRDGAVKIREILVLPDRRNGGIGRGLVEEIRRRHPRAELRASCPARYLANAFWRRMGFVLLEEKKGVNQWVLHGSSGAPTATQATADLPLPPAGTTG